RGRVKSIDGGTPDPAAVADAARYVKTLRDRGQLAAAGEQPPATGLTHQIERGAQGRQVLRREPVSISYALAGQRRAFIPRAFLARCKGSTWGVLFMEQSSSLRLFGRVFLIAILVLVAIWILRPLLPALAWAGVLALATWPAREWLIRKGMTTSGAAISLTLLVGILIVGPLIVVAIEMAREAVVIVRMVHELRESGLGTPSWVLQVPFLGDYVASW